MLECPICNEKFEKAIMSHVRQIHGMEPSEFKKKFPGVPMRQAWMKGLSKDDPRVARIAKASGDAKRGKIGSNASLKIGQWSKDHEKCIKCGLIEFSHSSNGLCTKCRTRESFDNFGIIIEWSSEEDEKLKDLLENSLIHVKKFHEYLNPGKVYYDIRQRMKELNLSVPTDRRKKMARQHLPIELTQEEESVIFGSLLGDGCICKQKDDNYCFRESHGPKQGDYTAWKAQKMQRWNPKCYYSKSDGTHIAVKNVINETDLSVFNYKFDLPYHDLWKEFYDRIYVSSKKRVISDWWMDKIDPLAVAIWIADDGSRHGNGMRLCTQNFSKECHEKIKTFFAEKFDVETRIDESELYFSLWISAENYRKLCVQLPWKELPGCMHYKFVDSLSPEE